MPLNNPTRAPRSWPMLAIVCAGVMAAGWALWACYAAWIDPPRAWRALLINFLYFFPLAIGMVIWPAIVVKSRGTWSAGKLEQTAFSALTFAPVAVVLFVLLIFGREHWATFLHHVRPPQGVWMNPVLVFARDGGGMVLMWVLGLLYARRVYRGLRPGYLGGVLVFSFCIVLTLVGFDMVMALNPDWYSALFGAYFFISSAYLALAAWTLVSLIRDRGLAANRRHDLGKLLVAFSLLTTYMMYSQLIVIWYENLPGEVNYVIPRLTLPPWRWVSVGLLSVVYLGPLVCLLLKWSKLNVPYMIGSTMAIMVGMWVERWWLVTPTLGGSLAIGWAELSATAGCAAAMVLGMGWFVRRWPPTRRAEVA